MAYVNLSEYIPTIREILIKADRNEITAREVRRQLEKKYKVDLTPRKQEVKRVVEQCFDDLEDLEDLDEPLETKVTKKSKKQNNNSEKKPPPDKKIVKPKGRPPKIQAKHHESDYSSLEDDSPPQRRKRGRKPKNSSAKAESSDAEYEKRFEEELNKAANRKKLKQKNGTTSKKKVNNKRKKRDDEEHDGEEPKKRKKGTTGIHKPLILSQVLAEFLQAEEMSRLEVVKRLWAYIKKNELQDPSDKRFIVCDERLMTIFKQDRIHSFTMNKFLTDHLKKKEVPSDGNVKNINGTSDNYRENGTSNSVDGDHYENVDVKVKIEPREEWEVLDHEDNEDYDDDDPEWVKPEDDEDLDNVKDEF